MCYFFRATLTPISNNTSQITMKIKNKVLAIEAAPAAIPVNPNIAATMAITKKIADHLSIIKIFR